MKPLKNLIKTARTQDWFVELTNKGHYKFVPPDKTKRVVYTGSTPSENRAVHNLTKDLQRSGLKL